MTYTRFELLGMLVVAGACSSGGDDRPSAPPAVDVTGTWNGTLHSSATGQDGLLLVTLAQQASGDVSGAVTMWQQDTGGSSTRWIDGWVSGWDLSLSRDLEPGTITFKGAVAADLTASGTYSLSVTSDGTTYHDEGSWSAQRLPAVAVTTRALFTLPVGVTAMTFDGSRLWLAAAIGGSGSLSACSYSLQGERGSCLPDALATSCDGSMAFDGEDLVCRGWNSDGLLTFVNPADGSVAATADFRTKDDQGNLWLAGWFSACALAADGAQTVRCFDSGEMRVLDRSGQVFPSVPVSLPHPTAAVAVGAGWWVADLAASEIFEVDDSGRFLGVADPPAMTSEQNLYAITWDGGHLIAAVEGWTGSAASTTLYEMTLD